MRLGEGSDLLPFLILAPLLQQLCRRRGGTGCLRDVVLLGFGFGPALLRHVGELHILLLP